MRITILGGFAGMTSTGAGASGYLVTQGDTSVVIDLGPGTLAELRRQTDIRDLDGIVVSHGHLDHVADLVGLHHVLRYSPTSLERRIPVNVPPGVPEQIDLWSAAMPGWDDKALAVAEYDPAKVLRIGSIEFQFAATVHPLQGWAMRLSTPGHGSIGYTADTGPSAHLDDLFAGVEVLVSEATLLKPDEPYESRGHLTAAEAGGLAARAQARTLILSHRWEETDEHALLARAALAYDGEIRLATPGLTVDLDSVPE